jgi:predicted dehydrogenase
MSEPNNTSRRDFLTASVAATTALMGQQVLPRTVHAASDDDDVKVALVGCGGRGTGAASQILQAHPSVRLWAMADLFSDRLEMSLNLLQKGVDARYDREAHQAQATVIDVPPERRFIGFDAYRQAIDSGVDVVILATTPHFRPQQFAYAVSRNVHAFIEKPVAVDAPGVRTVLEAAAAAKQKNVKVAAGFQRYHNPVYREAIERLQNGAVGQLSHLRTYFNHGATWNVQREPEWTEMEFQMRNWQHFAWTSGDHTCEQQAHSFHVVYWLLGRPPVSAVGMGGRQVCKGAQYGDVFDHHYTEFTYDDGLQLFAQDRQISGCKNDMSEWIHGSDGICELRQYRGATIEGANSWSLRDRGHNAYQLEHNAFVDAVRNDKPYNEGELAANSCMMSVMARMATYSGIEVTWEKALASQHRLGPETYAWDAEPPVLPGPDGTYEHAVAVPGITKPYGPTN